MERISQAPLANVLQTIESPSQRRLSASDGKTLITLIMQMADRYPSQDLTDSLEGYLWDFEQLALRYSLPKVATALAALRIRPGQNFFPQPNEVASEIERQLDECNRKAATSPQRQAQRKADAIAEFWQWAPDWMEMTGNNEEELLNRFPSFRGTRP